MKPYEIDNQKCEGDEYRTQIEHLDDREDLFITNASGWNLFIANTVNRYTMIIADESNDSTYFFDGPKDKAIVIAVTESFIDETLDFELDENWTFERTDKIQALKAATVLFAVLALIVIVIKLFEKFVL